MSGVRFSTTAPDGRRGVLAHEFTVDDPFVAAFCRSTYRDVRRRGATPDAARLAVWRMLALYPSTVSTTPYHGPTWVAA